MPSRKYCIVPMCPNTTVKTPSKLFFLVPRDAKRRKKWITVMKRAADSISPKSCVHCCEDHFDLEEDMENYIKYKLVGGLLKLKEGVCPHKFDCQKPKKKKIERTAFKKRQDIEFLKRVLSKDIEHEDLLLHPIEVVECVCQDTINQNSDPLSIPEGIDVLSKNNEKGQKTQAVQVNMKPKVRSKSCNTPIEWIQHIVKKKTKR